MVFNNKLQSAIFIAALISAADAYDGIESKKRGLKSSKDSTVRTVGGEGDQKTKSEKGVRARSSFAVHGEFEPETSGSDEIEGRFFISRPSYFQGSSPASAPGGGGVPLAYANTQFNPNYSRPASTSETTFGTSTTSAPVTSLREAAPSTTPAPTNKLTAAPVYVYGSAGVPLTRPGVGITDAPTGVPSSSPSKYPTPLPTNLPTPIPTPSPTYVPTLKPTPATPVPTAATLPPTPVPTALPTPRPSKSPTVSPTPLPTPTPTQFPTTLLDTVRRPGLSSGGVLGPPPSEAPTDLPSSMPSDYPSLMPSDYPSMLPSTVPSDFPSLEPSTNPTDPVVG